MEVIDTIAKLFGISGSELLTMGGVALVLVILWGVIRSALRIAFRVFALGCVTIMGVIAGLYVLFVILR